MNHLRGMTYELSAGKKITFYLIAYKVFLTFIMTTSISPQRAVSEIQSCVRQQRTADAHSVQGEVIIYALAM